MKKLNNIEGGDSYEKLYRKKRDRKSSAQITF